MRRNSFFQLKLLLFFLVFSFSISPAQQLAKSRRSSYYTYVFKLDPIDVKEMYRVYRYDYTHYSKTTPVDSFPTDSIFRKKLPHGYYFFTSVSDKRVNYKMDLYTDLLTKVIEHNRHFSLVVTDKNGVIQQNASVHFGKKLIPFDTQTQSFFIPKSKFTVLVTIETGDETVYYKYTSGGSDGFYFPQLRHLPRRILFTPARLTRRIIYFFNERNQYSGYMAFNKPKYLPGDTVKMKSFIVGRRSGKPLSKTVSLYFHENYGRANKKYLGQLKPLNDGNYTYEYILPDSLKAGKSYTFLITDKKNKHDVLTGDFLLEDYQLAEAHYEIRADKSEYHWGDPINLYLKGTDANNLPLLDASVELILTPEKVNNFDLQPVFVPNTIWTHKQPLDNLGETKITIPANQIPAAGMSVKLGAFFKNSNNESYQKYLSFKILHLKDEIKIETQGEYIIANYLQGNQPVKKEVTISGEDETHLIFKKKTAFPFKEKINPLASNYIFKTASLSQQYLIGTQNDEVHFEGSRSGDSIFFQLENPRKLSVRYSIMRANEKIKQGISDSTYSWSTKDESDASYYVFYSFVWGSKVENKTSSVHRYEKSLTVNMEQPEEIYPGQQATIKVKVRDYQNNPAPAVNLTASAINSQFGTTDIPTVPYFGKRKLESPGKRKPRNFLKWQSLVEFNQDFTDTITDAIKKRMGLGRLLYYQFLFPKDGAFYFYDSILSTNAQFSPHLVKGGELQTACLIYLDDELVYSVESTEEKKYAFIGEPGYHSIRIRTHKMEYKVDSVLLKKGWKLDFSIDVCHLPKNITAKKMPWVYTNDEIELLKNSMIILRNNYHAPAFLWQGDNVWLMDPSNDDQIVVGPLKQDNVFFAVKDKYRTDFIFEPYFEYTINARNQKMQYYEKNYRFMPNSYGDPSAIGDTAYTTDRIIFKSKFPKKQVPFLVMAPFNSTDRGGYRFNFESDSAIYFIKLVNPDSTSLAQYYPSTTQELYNIVPGYYSLIIARENGYCYKKDSVHIQANGILYENLNHLKFSRCSAEDIATPNGGEPAVKSVNVHRENTGPRSLSGTITDGQTDETLPGVTLLLYIGDDNPENAVAISTDINGFYSFNGIQPGKYKLVVSSIGYITQNLTATINTHPSSLDIKLKVDSHVLMETVVTSNTYGHSIGSVNEMSGKVAGVLAGRGLNSRVVMRGVSSLPASHMNVRFFDDKPTTEKYRKKGRVSTMTQEGEGSEEIIIPYADSLFNNYKNAKQIRDRFSDYAYWQPNLITDKNGEATFKASFPDNITKWDAYVIAMDGKKHSGIGYAHTLSYKKLMATLSVPRFLIEGDETQVLGKSLNYTTDSLTINTSFKINSNSTPEKTTILKDAFIEKTTVKAANKDTINVTYALQMGAGYKDGEKEKIPVFPIGVEETSGNFSILKKDTSFTLPLEQNKTYELYVQDDALQLMLLELDKLDKYPYYCSEQTASKLLGLLMEKKIREQTGDPVNKNTSIRKLIRKLEKSQHTDGSWGWWEKSTANVWMTTYVIQALDKAKTAGYEVESIDKAVIYLKRQLDVLEGKNLLYVLSTLSEMKKITSYAANLERLNPQTMSLYEKLMIVKIKQEQKLSYDTLLLTKNIKTNLMGGKYVGEESTDWYNNSIQLSLLAYQILSKDSTKSTYLEGIRTYLLMQKQDGNWRNTLETASILETILPDILHSTKKTITPASLAIKGNGLNLDVKKFPFKTTVSSSAGPLQINKTGTSLLYLTTYTKYWNDRPEKVDHTFEVKTYFTSKDRPVEKLKAGEPVTLIVDVYVKKAAEYTMIEVPIPGGCSYASNKENYSGEESNREYYKNKTLIFCEKLSEGKHQFTINLEPRFTGNYTLNPAKAELMYFPTFYGRTGIRKTIIEDK